MTTCRRAFARLFFTSINKNHKAEGETPSAYYGRKIDEKSFLSLASIKIPDGC
jgi:hypothetical protein